LDFELKMERIGDHYEVSVLNSPAGEASASFSLPFSEDRVENLILKLGAVRSGTRSVFTSELKAARELGGKLFEAVFSGEVRACLRSSLDRAGQQEHGGLRLKLRLQDAPELADLPWEYLFDSAFNRFFAQSIQTPIVRYMEIPRRISPLRVELPLRMLVMIASPEGHTQLDAAKEQSRLQSALEPLRRGGLVQVDWLEAGTLPALQRRLRDETYHIFHFIGHGGFDPEAGEGFLVLEDELGRGWQAEAHRLGTLLFDHRTLRLAVLNACDGARNSRTDPFAGTASTLIQQGVPAVVAMQFAITDTAAITFASEFYAALAQGYPVDAAVSEARKAIYAQPNDVEWGTPVLYMRTADGYLFQLQAGKAGPAKPEEDSAAQQTQAEAASPAGEAGPAKPEEHSPAQQTQAEAAPRAGKTGLMGKTGPAEEEQAPAEAEPTPKREAKPGPAEAAQAGVQAKPAAAQPAPAKAQASPKKRSAKPAVKATAKSTDVIDKLLGTRVIQYNGHTIEVQGLSLNADEIVKYDGREVSRKKSIFGATHTFRVTEDGEKVTYEVEMHTRWLSLVDSVWYLIRRNGKEIYRD
jgi:hypothetical protein